MRDPEPMVASIPRQSQIVALDTTLSGLPSVIRIDFDHDQSHEGQRDGRIDSICVSDHYTEGRRSLGEVDLPPKNDSENIGEAKVAGDEIV